MKQNIKSLVSGIVIGSMLTGGITLAKTGSETMEAWYSDIKIFVNGTKINPTDANGTAVEPFIVNGTTYLPVRAVGEALGKEVSWDGTTNSVYLTDKNTETVETPAPSATPKPTPKPTEKPAETSAPTEFSYTTAEILQISGYRQDAIKGEVTVAWDSDTPNASFYAKMRCNNGGLADYVDCEISLTEVISCEKDGFTGYFKIMLANSVKYEKIKGTVTVENNNINLHTEEYDYNLVASLGEKLYYSNWETMHAMGLDMVSFNGEQASGMIQVEFNEEKSDAKTDSSFTVGENRYTLQLHQATSITKSKLTGIFTLLCNNEPMATQVSGTLENLGAALGQNLTLTIEGVATMNFMLVETLH